MPSIRVKPVAITDANGLRWGEIFKKQIDYFRSPAGQTAQYNAIVTTTDNDRQAVHWAMAMAIYIFTGKAEDDGLTTAQIDAMKTQINALTMRRVNGHAGNAAGTTDAQKVNNGFAWNFGATHIVFHTAMTAYMCPDAFSAADHAKVKNMLLFEVRGSTEGLYTARGSWSSVTSVTVDPPETGGRQAVAVSSPRMMFTDQGSGYDPTKTYNITLNGPNTSPPYAGMNFVSTGTNVHGLWVKNDGSVGFPAMGIHESRVDIESYADDLSWTTWGVELAVSWYRDHPDHAQWVEFIKRNRLQMIVALRDLDDTREVDGEPLTHWITATNGKRYPNFNNLYLYGNHHVGPCHPTYTAGTLRATLAAVTFMLLGGNDVPQALAYSMRESWAGLSKNNNTPFLFNRIEGRITGGDPLASMAGGTVASQLNRVIQPDGRINWPSIVTDEPASERADGAGLEYSRRHNYWTFGMLAAFIKVMTNESNAAGLESAFLNNLEGIQENSGRILLDWSSSPGVQGSSGIGIQANCVRDVALTYLMYYMDARKSIPDLHTFPARTYPTVNAVSASVTNKRIAARGGATNNPNNRWIGDVALAPNRGGSVVDPFELTVGNATITGVRITPGIRRLIIYYRNQSTEDVELEFVLRRTGTTTPTFTKRYILKPISWQIPRMCVASAVILSQSESNTLVGIMGGSSLNYSRRVDLTVNPVSN